MGCRREPHLRAVKVRIRTDGAKVFVGVNDRMFLEIGAKEAKEFVRELARAALLAEEHEQAERLIHEGAILARAGFPLTLSDHPKILDAVRSEAAWNSDLRRYMPGGVKAKELVGTPTVIREST